MSIGKESYYITKFDNNDSVNDNNSRSYVSSNNSQNSSEQQLPNSLSNYIKNEENKYKINNNADNVNLLSTTENSNERYLCIVCGDNSDGLHFSQYTCRACAAFFRRTVSLKLEYLCKRENNCPVEKSARNKCRQCRYQKCLNKGMLSSAVQHARDGLGKRINNLKQETSNLKILKALSEKQQLDLLNDKSHNEFNSDNKNNITQLTISNNNINKNDSFTTTVANNSRLNFLETPNLTNNLTYSNVSKTKTGSVSELLLMDANNRSIFQLNGINASTTDTTNITNSAFTLDSFMPHNLIDNFCDNKQNSSYMQLGQSIVPPSSAFTPIHQPDITTILPISVSSTINSLNKNVEMKFLSRMLEGYQHFVSLRKASYTLIDGQPKFCDNNEIHQSNFGTSKKICKIEASLIMDTVEKFFIPFNTLSPNDKNLLFDSFYCLFSNTERAFQTYKIFNENDDRLIMPDGGYLRLSELEKFYENNNLVRGDPQQVAKIFENAIDYLINVVVAHMRQICITDTEVVALFGLFIWKDAVNASSEVTRLVMTTRENILMDLHYFYSSQGYVESEITIKIANLLLLMPKIEHSACLMKEDYEVAIAFNIMSLEEVCPLRNMHL